MCGISGIINKRGAAVDAAAVRAMNASIAHRGPDGEGEYFWKNLAFGHRRLSIIDLSECGHQPMVYRSGDLVLTFNGEIYNYLELREELQEKGHEFHSRSDTEVILAAYAEWGDACVERFNGMWAFALLDRKRQRIFCSRDRFGVKPFYFTESDGLFAFGSEIRQLLPFLPHVAAEREILVDFILTSISDHTDKTFFQGIRKLAGGHNLIYDLSRDCFTIERYYEIRRRTELESVGPEEAAEIYREVLEDAVKVRLRADVAVGTCLSGGLDSSSVASLAAVHYHAGSGRAFSAITAVSEQKSNDESSFAKLVVESGGMEWLQVKPSYEDFLGSLDAVVRAQEEPFGGPSLTMQYFVMKTARENGIPVLLDGQGGDETLLGYEKYYASYLATTWREQGISACLKAWSQASRNNTKMSGLNAAKFVVAGLMSPLRYRFYRHRHRYLTSFPPAPSHLRDFSAASWDSFALQVLEMTSTNLPVLLRYEDKNSMAHSIEARLPFLDYRAVETALSLPGSCKIRDGWSKWVLRRGMEGRLPDSILWRKNKFGFEAPEKIWLAKHAGTMRERILASPLVSEIADVKTLAANFESLDLRSRWRLYSIALWEESFAVAS